MPSITLTIRADGNTWRADNTTNAKAVNGNSDYTLVLVFEDGEWGAGDTELHLSKQGMNGERTAQTITTVSHTAVLPTMTDVYLLRVNVEKAGRKTTIPALIFCEPCITDDSGTAETPRADVFNLMTEYLSLKEYNPGAAEAVMAQLVSLRENAPAAFPGDAYRLATARAERVTKITGTITTASETLPLTSDDIIADSLSITTNAMDTAYLLPGGAPSAELQIGLLRRAAPSGLDGSEIELTYHIKRHDEIWCDIPLGTFTVASHDETERGYAVTAYDDMKKLEKVPIEHVLMIAQDKEANFAEIVRIILQAAKVLDNIEIEWDGVVPQYSGTPITKGGYAISHGVSSAETAWDLLKYALQIVGLVAYVDRFRVLRFRKLEKTAESARYTLSELIRSSVSEIQYRQAALGTTATFIDDYSGQSQTVRYLFDTFYTDGVTAYLPENPIYNGVQVPQHFQTKRALAGIQLGYLAEAISRTAYRPGEISTHGDPAIDLLNWIAVETPTGDVTYPVTSTAWRYRGEHTIAAVGSEAIAGVSRTQVEKKALSKEEQMDSNWHALINGQTLVLAHTFGHKGLSGFTHDWIAQFQHKQLPPYKKEETA